MRGVDKSDRVIKKKRRMDFLTAEISRKRKEIDSSSSQGQGSKYFRRGDIEREREREYLERQKEVERGREAERQKRIQASFEHEQSVVEARREREREEQEKRLAREHEDLSIEQVERRFREIGEPVCLFGETIRQRKARLKVVQDRLEAEESLRKRQEEERALEEDVETCEIDLRSLKTNPARVYRQIRKYIDLILHEWEGYIEENPSREEIKGSYTAAQKNLGPLMERLRSRDLSNEIYNSLAMITYFCQRREYIKANDAYLKLSIGNATWPIGLKEVGIHERSSRDRITTKQVANVLIDESTRKWLQSIKRCLTFAQTRWPPEDHSMRMG